MAQRTHPFAATVSTKSEVSGHQLARLRPRPRIALAGHSLDLRGGAVRLAGDRRQRQAHQRCGDPVCAASRAVFRMPLAPDPRLPDQPQNPARADDTGAAPFDTRASRRRSRRAATDPARRRAGRSHLAIDSTDLKVFGEGEWKIRLHGKDKRPSPRFLGPVAKPWLAWRKLHLAVDTTTGEILAHALTVNERHDGPELPRPAGQNQRAGVRPMPTRPMTRSPITRPFWREKKDR